MSADAVAAVEAKAAKPGRFANYKFDRLTVGQSFFVPEFWHKYSVMASLCARASKHYGKEFGCIRTAQDNVEGYEVYRSA
jgi:hypothetical protein